MNLDCFTYSRRIVRRRTRLAPHATTQLQQSIQRAVRYEDKITEENLLNIKVQTQQT